MNDLGAPPTSHPLVVGLERGVDPPRIANHERKLEAWLRRTPGGRLLPILATTWAAALAGEYVQGLPHRPALLTALVVTGLLGVILLLRRMRSERRGARVSLSLRVGALCVVIAAGQLLTGVLAAELHVPDVLDEAGPRTVAVEGTLLSAPTRSARTTGPERRSARASELVLNGREVAGTVRVLWDSPWTGERGERFRARARVLKRSPHGGDRALLALQPEVVRVRSPAETGGLSGLFAVVRAELRAQALRFPGDGGDLLPGLVDGDTSLVPADLNDAMRVSGLSHLTAVSAANCAIVTGAVFALLGRLWMPRRVRLIGAAVALGGFVVFVGDAASVLRAGVSGLVVLGLLYRGRPRPALAVLSLAGILLLLVEPALARDLGFALSVAATLGILLLVPPLEARWSPVLGRALTLVIAVPLAAQLACQPIISLLGPGLPVLAIPANILAEPAAPLATVLGLLVCVVAPVFPGVAHLLCALSWAAASWIAAVARAVARLPQLMVPWPGGLGGAALSALLGAVVLLLVLSRGTRRRCAVVLIGALVLGGVGGGLRTNIQRTLGIPRDWSLAVCDVGQGDALLVRAGDTVLSIDTGPDPASFERCLADVGVTRISTAVLSHFDADHAGGFDALRERAAELVVPPPARASDERLLARAREAGMAVRVVESGMRDRTGEISWSVLWPPPGLPPDGNATCVVLEVTTADIHALFLGDLPAVSQSGLLGRPGFPETVDVVKVAHHGSADQDPALYAQLHPEIAVLSVGAHNRFGHPRPDTLALLARTTGRVCRTDQEGLVLVGRDPSRTLWTWAARGDRCGGTPGPSGSATESGRDPPRLPGGTPAHRTELGRDGATDYDGGEPRRTGGGSPNHSERIKDSDPTAGMEPDPTRTRRSGERYGVLPGPTLDSVAS